MAIPASQIVQVLPRILSGTGSDLVFNGLFLSENELLPTGRVISFANAEEVSAYFGANSAEYSAAAVYFGGYTGSQVKPSLIYFYRLLPNAVAPFIRGASVAPAAALAALKAITAGNFAITIDGTEILIDNLDLSGITSLSDAAQVLETAIQAESAESGDSISGVSVAFSSLNNTFTITDGVTGAEASLSAISGTIADVMGLTSGTTSSAGADAQTVTETMNTIIASFQNFVTFAFLTEPDDADALLAARWASTQSNAGNMYLFVLQDSDANNADGEDVSVIAEVLKANNIGATCICYPDTNMAAFIMGIAASINWDARRGTLTFAFKAQDGLGASVESASAALGMQAHSVNYIGNYATRNDNFVWLYNGSMLGDWSWIDTYLNAVWLCNALQVQLMAMFQANRRIPYTEAGYAIIRANCRDVIDRAVFNGVIDAGVTLSNAQKAALTQELGADYSDEIRTNGYYLQIEDATAQTRQQRNTPPCNLVYTYGGSVHKLNLPAIAVV